MLKETCEFVSEVDFSHPGVNAVCKRGRDKISSHFFFFLCTASKGNGKLREKLGSLTGRKNAAWRHNRLSFVVLFSKTKEAFCCCCFFLLSLALFAKFIASRFFFPLHPPPTTARESVLEKICIIIINVGWDARTIQCGVKDPVSGWGPVHWTESKNAAEKNWKRTSIWLKSSDHLIQTARRRDFSSKETKSVKLTWNSPRWQKTKKKAQILNDGMAKMFGISFFFCVCVVFFLQHWSALRQQQRVDSHPSSCIINSHFPLRSINRN